MINYLAERIEPAANTETLSESALYADYQAWCRTAERMALPVPEFVTGLDQLRADNGLGKSVSARIVTAASASSPRGERMKSEGRAGVCGLSRLSRVSRSGPGAAARLR